MRPSLSIAAIAVCALAALMPLHAHSAKTFHPPSPEDDRALRTAVDNIPATGEPVACNQDFEPAYRALLNMWGRDPKRFPAAYRTLDKLKASKWKFPDRTATGRPVRYGMNHAPDDYSVVHITATDVYFRNVTAMSFSTMFVNDTDTAKYENQTVNVYTKDSNGLAYQLIASGTNDGDASMRYMPVVAEGFVNGPNNPSMANVITVATFLGEAGGSAFCWNVRMDRDRKGGTTSVNVWDPTFATDHQPPATGKDRTIICLNRGATNTVGDFCDYGPTQPGTENDNLNLLFPFAGTLTTLNNIYTVTLDDGRVVPGFPSKGGGKPASLMIKLVKVEGGACDAVFNLGKPWLGFYVNGNKLTWQFSNPNDRTDASKYLSAGSISACTALSPSDVQDWFMVASLYDVVNGQPMNYIPVGLGSLQDVDGYDANKLLPPVGFQWGCVIEGTPVSLADGGTVPIEKLKAGDIVMGPSGKRLRVTGITPGHDRNFVKLMNAAGDAVVVTFDHPVLTTDGMRRADHLKVGDTVYGRNGPSALREVRTDHREKPAAVYSVHLAAANGGALADTDDHAFYAGAILVGDHVAQAALRRQAAKDRMHGKK
jgi:hypothetical protein